MKAYSLRFYVDFLIAFTEKEIKARYKRAVFGFLWVLLNPLLQMLVIGLVFSFFIKIPNYYLFLFPGLLVWNFVTLSLTKVTPSVVYSRDLLKKANFPREVIILSIVLANFFHLMISFGLLVGYLVLTGVILLPNILGLVVALGWVLVLVVGLSLMTATLNVRYRDVNFLVQSGLILWFYVTPVLYSVELVPTVLKRFLLMNPLVVVFELLHWSVVGSGLPTIDLLVTNGLVTIGVILLGVWIFTKQNKFFVDWL